MVAHRSNDRLGGQREVFLLKRSAERCRVFHEVQHLLEEVGRDLLRAAARLCHICNLRRDHRTPPHGIRDDVRRFARRLVIRRTGNRKVLRRERPMPARTVAARHFGKCKRYDVRAVERDDPTNWADEAEVEIAPPHTVRQGNRTNERGQEFL